MDRLRRLALANAVEEWIASKPSECTHRSYRSILTKFAAWAAEGDLEASVERLCVSDRSETEQILRAWTKPWSPTYGGVGRAVVSSLVRHLHEAGLCPYTIDGHHCGLSEHKDAGKRSPASIDVAMQLLAYAKREAAGGAAQDVRDYAFLRLALVEGMRRTAIGRLPKGIATDGFTPETVRAIDALKRIRGEGPGWLFVRTDRDDDSKPLAGESSRRLMEKMCEGAGIPFVQPDVLRKHAEAARLIEMDHDRLSAVDELVSVAMRIGFMEPGAAVEPGTADAWNEAMAKMLGGVPA